MDGEATSVQARRARTLFGRLAPCRSGIARRHENPGKAPQGPKSDPSTHAPKYPGQTPDTGRFARPPPAKWLVFPCFPRKYGYIPRHLTRKHGLKGRPVAAGPKRLVCSHVSGGTNRRTDLWRYPIFLCVSCLRLACTLVTNRTAGIRKCRIS